MKNARGNVDENTVADIMDEMEDEKEIMNQIGSVFSRAGEDLQYDDGKICLPLP